MYPESALDEHGGISDSSRRVLRAAAAIAATPSIPEGEAAVLIGAMEPCGVYHSGWTRRGTSQATTSLLQQHEDEDGGHSGHHPHVPRHRLEGVNAVLFKQPLDLYPEFIPQVLFTLCLFGYMIVLIFMKWMINWTTACS